MLKFRFEPKNIVSYFRVIIPRNNIIITCILILILQLTANANDTIVIDNLDKPADLKGTWQIRFFDEYREIDELLNDPKAFRDIADMPGSFMDAVHKRKGKDRVEGFVQMRCVLRISSGIRGEQVKLNLPPIKIADKTYFNGIFIGKDGKFPPNWFSAWNSPRLYSICSSIIKYDDINYIDIFVYYNGEGILNGNAYIMKGDDADAYYSKRKLILQYISMLILSLLISFCIYYVIFFITNRNKESLFFIILVLSQCIRSANDFLTSREIPLSYLSKDKIVFISVYITAVSLIYFMQEYFNIWELYKEGFKRYFNKWFGYIYGIAALICSLMIIFTGSFEGLISLVAIIIWIPVVSIFYILGLSFMMLIKRRKYSISFFIYILIIMALGLNDAILRSSVDQTGVYLLGFAFPFLIISVAISMAQRFIRMNNKLNEYSSNLEKMVQDRTIDLEKARDRAESASRFKSEFLANMSHEIRTPLNAVIGFSEILASGISEEKESGYIKNINTAGKSLLLLINDILDISRIESGNLVVEYNPINLVDLLDEIDQIFRMELNKDVQFLIDVQDDLPQTILLDGARLRQVLLNLVGNAVKFTERGHVKISVLSEFADEKHLEYLLISIEDTGVGIPDDGLESIFETFQQESRPGMRNYGGTGLGLAISKYLVEAMDGEISVKSRVGEGSQFTISLRNVEIPPKTG